MFFLKISTLFLLAGLTNCATPKRWALLVAGSNTWWNYRHQADVCHAYQIVRKAIPEENIITMMYDDIVNSSQNPQKGTIINKPGGPNVYNGVKIDYKGEDLTPTNFLNILQGNKEAMKGIGSGKVIESGPDDLIFVNFADHGGVGLLCFPSEYLYAKDLEAALASMAEGKKFGKMIMYIEACEAGSMFDHLLSENTNIFVSTASAADESSFGWYCDSPLGTCLGDLYSISWMEHMDTLQENGLEGKESLFHQYQLVRTAVNESHVQLYGDFKLGFGTVGSFLGSRRVSNLEFPQPEEIKLEGRGVSSHDIPIYITKKKIEQAVTFAEKQYFESQLQTLINKRNFADFTISKIVSNVAENNPELINEIENKKLKLERNMFDCYKRLISQFNKFCFNTYENTYLVRHFYKFVNLCSVSWTHEETIEKVMSEICTQNHRNNEGII